MGLKIKKLGHILYAHADDKKTLQRREELGHFSGHGYGIIEIDNINDNFIDTFEGITGRVVYEKGHPKELWRKDIDFDAVGVQCIYDCGRVFKEVTKRTSEIVRYKGIFKKKPVYEERKTTEKVALTASEVLKSGDFGAVYALQYFLITNPASISEDKRPDMAFQYYVFAEKDEYKKIVAALRKKGKVGQENRRKFRDIGKKKVFKEWWDRYLDTTTIKSNIEFVDNFKDFGRVFHF